MQFRRRHPELFQEGRYLPLTVQGPGPSICVPLPGRPQEAAAQRTAIVVAPRLLAALTPTLAEGCSPPPLGKEVWEETRVELPAAVPRLKHLFTGQWHAVDGNQICVADVLSDFPVGVLTDT